MGDKRARGKELCRNFCIYYKPGKYEDLSCLASLVVESLAAKRGDLVLAQGAGRAIAAEGMLVEMMCKRCPFHPEDCDYIIRKGDAPPCGGLLALSGLLREKVITLDEIRDALDRLF